MKKKFSFLLVTVMAISLLLSACGYENPDQVEYNGRMGAELKAEMDQDIMITDIICRLLSESEGLSIADYENEEFRNEITGSFAEYYGIKVPEVCFHAVVGWDALKEECGEWTGEYYLSEEDKTAGKNSYSVDIAGKTMTTNAILDFSKRDVEVQMVYNVYNNELTSIDFTPSYTTGEKLQKAGLNTLISMLIVFFVLILISIIIWAFNIFPYLENKKKAKSASKESAGEVVTQIAQREEQQSAMDDTELIAVIAAAIAASEGTSTSDFVVRSINRR